MVHVVLKMADVICRTVLHLTTWVICRAVT